MPTSLRHHFAGFVLLAALMLLLLCTPRAAAAGQSQQFGDHVVYYSALSTDMLTPEVARAYGLVRSSHQGLLNIAIRRAGDDGPAETGTVRGSAVNLSGQRVPVKFQEVRDGEAIYYLGTFPISGSDTVRFDLTVTPKGDAAHRLDFSRDYVVD